MPVDRLAQSVLNTVTQGGHSRLEHKAVSATQLAVIVYLLIAMIADDRARHRDRGHSPEQGPRAETGHR